MNFISVSDLCDSDWRFLEPYCDDPDVKWTTHSGRARTAFERAVRKPNLGRYRAAFSATKEAGQSKYSVLVSHLPLMGAATNMARRRNCPETPHIGFSFNFTTLPTGLRRRYLSYALSDITECTVYSRFELDLYPRYFDMDPDKFRFLPWAMDPPEPGAENLAGLNKPYVCSIGGEGRDYGLLADVMRQLPHITMVVVARPRSIVDVVFPENVIVFTNLPLENTWRIAKDSMGMALPLQTAQTACGHITMVGAQLLGIPLVVTRSQGVSDYVLADETARLVDAKDGVALKHAIVELFDSPKEVQDMAKAGFAKAYRENSPHQLLQYFLSLKDRFA